MEATLPSLHGRLAELYGSRWTEAVKAYCGALKTATDALVDAGSRSHPTDVWRDAATYWLDFGQRSILFWDTLRQRGNNWLAHERAGKPPLLAFDYEMVADARTFDTPVNYALVRITPPAGVVTDPDKRPFVVIDPRAGHGPGIGGFKQDSQVGLALRAGHPVYAVIFFPEPMPGQTLADVSLVETEFLRMVGHAHPAGAKPVIIGNCQGGWAAMLVAALAPDSAGPLVINGAPMSYWAGNDAENPMRYAGGILGGTWSALLASDLGGGIFDGAYLVDNFEYLNPANTYVGKYYTLFSKIDTEPERFLEFERWWGGYFLMNEAEIRWIVENLFVGNKLASGEAEWGEGRAFDLRAIRSPMILFASLGDNITPPQQAFNWVADLYPTTEDLKENGQIIIGLMHESVGHLGIFVSGAVARREHAQIIDLLDYIEHLPPGLYGMKITEDRSSGKVVYDVTLTERRVEELRLLQKYDRRDEIPFAVVADISKANVALYEAFAQPWLKQAVPPEIAKIGRMFHPLRMQRWAVSELNPWLSFMPALADAARANRMPRNEKGLSTAMERCAVACATAGLDLYRQLRDATVEHEFFSVYGPLSLARPKPEEEEARPPRSTAAMQEALAHMEFGGFTDAAVRIALLAAKRSGHGPTLSRLKQVRALVGDDVGLLDRPIDEARAIILRQSLIVDNAPERALQTLPALLHTEADRTRFVSLLDRLAANLKLEPAQLTLIPEVTQLLSPHPAVASSVPAPFAIGQSTQVH